MITVDDLCKDFKVPQKDHSFKSQIKYFFKRDYCIKSAVKDISFHISKSEIIGLIGPNGAGKSTIINLLSGGLIPTSGEVRVFGIEPYKHKMENAKRIGVVLGNRSQLWNDMLLIDSLELNKSMYSIPNNQYKRNIDLFCDLLGLGDFLYSKVSQLSLGQRMRAEFACTMLHNPQILYLDEPTIGLDVIAKDKICNFILEANKQRNITVVLSTRDVIEIERLCSRVLVINNGQLVYNGNLRRMKDLYSSIQTIQVEVAQRLPDIQDLAIIKYVIDNKFIKITYDNNIINSSEILNHILKQCQIKSIKTFEPKIDDVIRNMYEKFKY